MSSLSAFLNPVKTENKEVIVSKRFMENGEVVPFIIRPITQEENSVLLKKHTKKDPKKGTETFNRTDYMHELTASGVVYPDLKSAELQKGYDTLGESNLLRKMLYVGEYAELAQAVQALSGLDSDINEDVEEAKN